MVLVGQLFLSRLAGNGLKWVGTAPYVRLWKTFALLSVWVCQDCVRERKIACKRNKLIGIGVFIVLALYSFYKISIDIFPAIFGVVAIGRLVDFIFWLAKYKEEEGVKETVLSHYIKHIKIQQKDIVAVANGALGEEIGDSDFAKDDLLHLGDYRNNYYNEKYAENLGWEQARSDARILFEKTGVSFENK